MSYACGNAIVCDDLAIAKFICYEKGVEAKAVTLDGTVIHKGGLMTGGRGREQNSRRWEDIDVESLRKLAGKLRKDLSALPEARRNVIEEEILQGDQAGLEQRLAYAREEAKAHDRNLASKKKEVAHAEKELREVKPRYTAKLQELEYLNASFKKLQDVVSEVEDEVFEKFCARLGYENIRIYEAQQGSLQREGVQKRLEFRQQTNRLESRICFEQQGLQETKDRINGLEDRTKQDQALIDGLEAQKESISEESDDLAAELEQLKTGLEEHQKKYAKMAEKVSDLRREVQKRSKNVDGTLKAVATLEVEAQRNATNRYALLRRCKLEDITIPLVGDSNSLDQLPIDGMFQGDPDAMDMDEDPDSSIRPTFVQDYGIRVEFGDLQDDLKEVRSSFYPLPSRRADLARARTKKPRKYYKPRSKNLRTSSTLWHRICVQSNDLRALKTDLKQRRRTLRMLGSVQNELRTTSKKLRNNALNYSTKHSPTSLNKSDQSTKSLQTAIRSQWGVKRAY
jgi:structural maintenance of chromosome 1